ncbi:serine hydrolase domain-containing protein [Actinomadura sp. DC4]|uniref:serine hydrolase domain-containing protein n=1 Tax=Actinomadura sp. DC4 TaxID=3055069 RepID=UPI0025B1923E|nr:serine hydrolase domain-containing protein [Actinomadura sp. DC4]MDN3351409.1 serine hydrolase domain-containing protein [Actinomadura sp. DC4]
MQAVRSAVVVFVVLAATAACSDSSSGGGTADPPAARSSTRAPAGDPLATSPAPQGDRTAAAMQTYLKGLAAKKRFTGAALVLKHGEVLARFAAGQADEAKHIAVRPDTIFRLASVSKQFTAMLVLKQRDRGRLKIGDRICPYLVPKYVKACPKAWRSITIRQILSHTSGIPDISEMPDFFPKLPKPTTTQEIISRFANKPLDFRPGTNWKYSNSGYILAGAIVEKVAKKPYGTVLHDDITGPLGLAHTGFSSGYPPTGFAKGYLKLGTPAAPINGSQANAAGGVYSTVDDLGRWDRSFGADKVAPAATVKEAFTPLAHCPSGGCLDSPSTGYAYGWLVDKLRGHRYLYHPGLLQGYHASNAYLPDDDIAVVVLSNVQNTDVNGINRHLSTMALTGRS